MDVAEIRTCVSAYHSDGYAVLRDAISAPLLNAAEQVLDEHEGVWERQLERRAGGRSWISHAGEVTFTAKLAGSEPVLRDLLSSSVLSALMRVIVGPSVRLYFDQAVYKKPGCQQVVAWHQDNGYNPKVPSNYMSFWIPLTDTTSDNGTIRFQPGRHVDGPLPHWRDSHGYLVCQEGANGGVPVELRRGDVVAFSSLLPHASGPNVTRSVRKAYIASCVTNGTRLVDGTLCDDPHGQPLLRPSPVRR